MAFTVTVIERDHIEMEGGKSCDGCSCCPCGCVCPCVFCGTCSCDSCTVGLHGTLTSPELATAPLSPLEG
jgi:hypothetical protein